MLEELQAELRVLNLLRQVFLKEPGKDLLEGMGRIVLPREEKGEAGGLKTMVDSVRKNKSRLEEWREELSLEFARLFIGPVHAPAVPYASFYLSETASLMTEETLEVRKRYLAAGLALKDLYQIPDDHVAMEVEFLYYLTREAIHAMEAGKKEEASRFLSMRNDFIKGHMSLWVPLFAERIVESTNEGFFQGAAMLLQDFIDTHR
jgi:TorA maturation chaperone TorD